jgi:AcrR family transcriptional regulator
MAYRQTARSEKVRAASRARLLAAARKLFARQGYQATTMQQVVREAETSIGNAYFYFENKEELLKTLIEEPLRASWARTDLIIASVEAGPARIAVNVYSNTMILLGAEKDVVAAALTGAPSVVSYITQISWERLSGLFKANFPDLKEKKLLMVATAVFGANRMAAEFCLGGVVNIPAREFAEFLVTWNLRALKVPEREIARVLKIAARAINAEKAETSRTRRK